MPEIHHVWTENNPWRDAGTQDWDWPSGEGQHYWGFSVRPFQNRSTMLAPCPCCRIE
jgi:hypothetical protein